MKQVQQHMLLTVLIHTLVAGVMTHKALFVLALTAEVLGVGASWGFSQKRYTEEALVDAGSLGVEGVGRVVAVGDWNGDQQYVARLLADVLSSDLTKPIEPTCSRCLMTERQLQCTNGTEVCLPSIPGLAFDADLSSS